MKQTNTASSKLAKITLMSTLGLVGLTGVGCANNNSVDAEAETPTTAAITEQSSELEKVGYSIGYMMAEGNKEMVDDLNLDTFEMGFRDAYMDKEAALTDEQMQEVIVAYQERKQTEMMEEMQQKAVTNKAEGDKFLAQNATAEGIKTTDSGLQYKVLTAGTGASPSDKDLVKVHYEGKLLDGTVFDSSYERDEPAIFGVAQMIPGFSEALKLMQEGGKYEVFIPADLAYGETGAPGIDPNSTLNFTVELLEVNPEVPQMPTQ